MSNGRTHARVAQTAFALALLPSAGTMYVTYATPAEPWAWAATTGALIGMIVGIYVTPDMDVDAGNYSDARVRRRYGKAGQWAWRRYWNGYARKHTHRGVSHRIGIGTWTRWRYVLVRGGWVAWAFLLYILYSAQLWELLPLVFLFTAAAFAGNVFQDWLHLIWDGRIW